MARILKMRPNMEDARFVAERAVYGASSSARSKRVVRSGSVRPTTVKWPEGRAPSSDLPPDCDTGQFQDPSIAVAFRTFSFSHPSILDKQAGVYLEYYGLKEP